MGSPPSGLAGLAFPPSRPLRKLERSGVTVLAVLHFQLYLSGGSIDFESLAKVASVFPKQSPARCEVLMHGFLGFGIMVPSLLFPQNL
jgi:hypothetical protein